MQRHWGEKRTWQAHNAALASSHSKVTRLLSLDLQFLSPNISRSHVFFDFDSSRYVRGCKAWNISKRDLWISRQDGTALFPSPATHILSGQEFNLASQNLAFFFLERNQITWSNSTCNWIAKARKGITSAQCQRKQANCFVRMSLRRGFFSLSGCEFR